MSSSIPEQGVSGEGIPVADDNVGGDPEVDQAGDNAPEISTEPQQNSGQETSPTNDLYQKVLEGIPEGFKGQIEPHLKEWDKGVNERFQQRAQEIKQAKEQLKQYEPYKQFVEQRVDPRQLYAAQVLVSELNKDPRAFYDKLAQHYGFTSEQAQQAANQEYDPNEDEGQQNIDPQLAQQMQQLQMTQQQINQFLQNQQQEQIQQEARQQVDAEFDAVVEKYNLGGPEHSVDRREVLQRAVLMAQQNPDDPNVFEKAFREWDQLKRSVYAQNSANQAPSVVNPGGGSPQQKRKSFAEMSEKEQTEDLTAALMEAFKE